MKNSLGENLKYYRENAKLSQSGLAKEMHISQQAISLWEKDERAPSVFVCIKLADFYGITLDELVGRDFR